MNEGTTATFLHRVKSPEEQLRVLRIPVAVLAAIASVLYPWAMMAAIMASDSGTSTAMRVSYLSLFGFTFYLAAVVLAAIKWSDRPIISAILLALVTITNLIAVLTIPFVTARIALFPLGFLGIQLPDLIFTILGCLVFSILFILVPGLSVWRLYRHASDADEPPSDQTFEPWDLKRLSSR